MDVLPIVLDWLAPRLGSGPTIIGLSGAQGSGKSTLAAQMAAKLPGVAVAVSLDDFYLTRARRLALAARVHPLFATRGPPGTHDLPLLLDTLLRVRAGRPVCLPVFDKLADDRLPPQHWRPFERIDCLILEGWCIGARTQPAALLAEPINALEAREDPDARWRIHINQSLAGQYQRVWAMLDQRAFLAAPDWPTILRWRMEQEIALARASGRTGKDAGAISRFCAHFERLTRWQMIQPAHGAGLVITLDSRRKMSGLAM